MSFSINNTAVDPATEEGQIRLGKAHQERSRVICNCSSPAPAMYVACVNDRFILKRMPGSGPEHAPGCDSFLPPEDLSGLAQVQGNAIKEDLETGITSLKVDFSLSMGSKRPAPPPPSGKAPTEAKITPRKLGLSSLLQYLWHEADLVKWTPAMKGKRWWGPVQRALGTAAVGKTAKSRDGVVTLTSSDCRAADLDIVSADADTFQHQLQASPLPARDHRTRGLAVCSVQSEPPRGRGDAAGARRRRFL